MMGIRGNTPGAPESGKIPHDVKIERDTEKKRKGGEWKGRTKQRGGYLLPGSGRKQKPET